MKETLRDLYYIKEYAIALKRQLQSGKPPAQDYLKRMAELAEKVRRQYDAEYSKWCDSQLY